MRKILFFIILACTLGAHAQQKAEKLTVEKIMRDPKWMGSSPSSPMWSADGKYLYFSWNPDKDPSDSLYFISKDNKVPTKASTEQKKQFVSYETIVYNQTRTAFTYAKDGDIFFTDIKSGNTRCIIKSTDVETNPQFSFSDKKIVYTRLLNLYAWDIKNGETTQLTRIQNESSIGAKGPREKANIETPQEKWLNQDQLQTFDILRERKNRRDATESYNNLFKDKELRSISLDDKRIQNLSISFDGRFICFRLTKNATANKNTIVPNYVTESGFTTDIPGRTKVGEIPGSSEMFVYDRLIDSLFTLKTTDLPGIKDQPDYLKDYPKLAMDSSKKKESRLVYFGNALWSPKGNYLMLDIRSQDNKDRWLMAWDSSTCKMSLADRQRDEAWVGGAGNGNKGWIDDSTFWFQSEATGFSHLYSLNLKSGVKKALTSGGYEVQDVQLSANRKDFYITTNQVHPGEKHFYRVPVTGGKSEKLTNMQGANLALLSPDEKMMALLYSYSTKPTELYIQENETGKTAIQITDKAQSAEFKSYEWQDPQVITFKARDGADVYSRIYIPANPDPKKPAVLFVHGAGYLQNAHKWWSSYFREFMFNQMLVKEGYYVMDIDYRGSAGYGRDWRTGIYRHMGGKDLTDQVDAADYLVKRFGVSKDRIGLYGGSYGGFITIMAMFTTPDAFAAGAALRPVTDWANYNHGYTSNILNEPFKDSIAYRKSSPLYFADGLKGNLLICHGMVDVNVNYQDAVKLSQRLIELHKDNWELASYPMEDHGFVEPSSWTDEYKRIFKLFETVLKK